MIQQDEELTKYLAELAVTNPEQLPLAMLQLIQHRLMLTSINYFKNTIDAYVSQLEKNFKDSLDNERRDSNEL